ncbi:MAG: alpha/beta hydrolase [Pseudomonadota bacterium]
MNKSNSVPVKQSFSLALLRTSIRLLANFSPRIVGKILYFFWFRPIRFIYPIKETKIIQQAKTVQYPSAHSTIQIYSWGQGPTVLFMHGWSGRGTQICDAIKPLVEAGFKVVTFDGPAHGKSSGTSTDIFQYAEICDYIFSHYGPLHGIIAHSMGAMVFSYAYQQNMPLNKAIFISAPASLQTMIDHYQKLLAVPTPIIENFVARLKKNYGENIFAKISLLTNSQKIHAPLLVMHDENDDVVPITEAEKIIQANPQAKYIKTRTLGHNPILNDKQVIQHIVDFIVS